MKIAENLKDTVRTMLFKKAKAYKTVFETEEGKIVLDDLLKFCKVDSAPSSENTNLIIERNGMRKVGLYLIGMSNQDEETLDRLLNNINNKK